MLEDLPCTICGGVCIPLDVIDFNRSGGAETRGDFRPLSGIPIYYYLCKQCSFCFAPEISKWSLNDFSEKIYNEEYIEVDPDHEKVRPEENAAGLIKMFKGKEKYIKHLDYGGGNGLLSNLIKKSGWDSLSYDPFINKEVNIKELESFNLITAFEVFEHVPDVNDLMSQLDSLLKEDGIILLTTLFSDGNIEQNHRLSWWYASPRNGHISLFSKNSLYTLAGKYRFQVASFSSGFHVLYRRIPLWAAHMFNHGS